MSAPSPPPAPPPGPPTPPAPTALRDWLARLPKVELHLHLEGAVPLPALWTLIRKYGGDPDVPDPAALARRFRYRDFAHFIETWVWKNGFLREYDDFELIAEAAARELARQNIRYAEIFFSPSDFGRAGLDGGRLAAAIRAGLARVPAVEVALVADLVRDRGPEGAAVMLERLHEVRELGIVGVGIGGSEQLFPPEPFAPVYERARRLDFRTSAHAGEAAGPESVWGALRALRVDRVGHGTRAAEDEALVDHLAERAIPLEMCPLSNLMTGVVPRIEDHPVRRFCARGIVVTINTDDPAMFGNSLVEEYATLVERLAFSRADIRRLILNGLAASWLPADRRRELAGRFQADPAWLEDGA